MRCHWRSLLLGVALLSGRFVESAPVINEFLAANGAGLRDEDGEFSDWIEIRNPDDNPVSLGGFHLTDDAANLVRWTFPALTLEPHGYLVVFASGKNRTNLAGPLHTNFKLATEGGYLALVAPDGLAVLSAFAPGYPAQFENVSFGLAEPPLASDWTFFANPTPGAPNVGGTRAGPVVEVIEPNPARPSAPAPLTVSARVRRANDPVSTVTLYYRRGYNLETAVRMSDDGTGSDAAAGDGVWTGVIPDSGLAPGQMTRWRFVATDTRGTTTREPAFRDPLDSPQYFGTVTTDPAVQSLLPVLHWFGTNLTRADTATGARGCVYYGGEFYDNVLFTLHGQSSAGFPKKSYNLDFTRNQRFRWSTNAPRVADVDLLTNWADKSKTRHVLGYEVMRLAGVPAHFAYTVRVQRNGEFFSTADIVEDADEIYLERAGLNRDGALYKVYANLLNKDAGNTGNTGVEKKTRQFENNADLQALINGLDLTGAALVNYLHDHIDIPRCVNMLAANSVIRNIDMHSKNWYLYRDTGRSGEWAILPWDLDLSHGRVWNTANTYFDNALYTDGYIITGDAIRLVAQLFSQPDTRAMLLRRIRTLTDRFLQPPPPAGTPESALYYERRLNELSALIDPPSIVPSDARRDFEKWGSWLQGGRVVASTDTSVAVETMAEGIQRWKTEYLPGRRSYIYNSQVAERGGILPRPQTGGAPGTNVVTLVAKGATARVLVPINGNLGLTWTGDPAREPFDTTGWTAGPTGVGFERATGYEALIGTSVDAPMRANTSAYIRIEFNVDDPTVFDSFSLRMQFDDGFAAFLNGAPLVSAYAPANLQWNSAATVSHEANANAFVTYDVSDRRALLRPGRNVLAIQGLNESLPSSDFLVLPELVAGRVVPPVTREPRIQFGRIEATPVSGNQDEEFIELKNTNSVAVDVSEWRLTGAIEHTFVPGTVIPANGALFLSPNSAAFRARTASPKGGEGRFVQGGYRGHLSAWGETLVLLDAAGTTNNVTTYEAQPSDAQRYLTVSELLYRPAGSGLAEFVELLNLSPSVTVSLRNVRFGDGIDFAFTNSPITSLAPGSRVVVVRDVSAFRSVYGTNRPVAGVFANGTALANEGERVKLEDGGSGTILEFTYADQSPWPAAGKPGYSLVLVAPESHPDLSSPASWRVSRWPGGSPGFPESDAAPADPWGDADRNGERDLLDFVLGNPPGQPPIVPLLTSEAPTLGGSSTALQLTYPLRSNVEPFRCGVVFSTDLVTWQDATPYLEVVSRQDLPDGRQWVRWNIQAPLRDAPRVFLRLQALAQ